MTKSRNRIGAEKAWKQREYISEAATTSGTSHDFTGIPEWVTKITLVFVDVSTSGTSNYIVQIGDSGGIETTGYNATEAKLENAAAVAITGGAAGFYMKSDDAAQVLIGEMVLHRYEDDPTKWVAVHNCRDAANHQLLGAGDKVLTGTLDRVRITTSNGTDTFDAGTVTLYYE